MFQNPDIRKERGRGRCDSKKKKKDCKVRWEYKKDSGDLPAGLVAKTLGSSAGGLGLILGQGTKSHVQRLRVHMPQLKTQCNQINKYLRKKRNSHSPVTKKEEERRRILLGFKMVEEAMSQGK